MPDLGGCPEFDERIMESVFAPAPDAVLDGHLADCERCRAARDLNLSMPLWAALFQKPTSPLWKKGLWKPL